MTETGNRDCRCEAAEPTPARPFWESNPERTHPHRARGPAGSPRR